MSDSTVTPEASTSPWDSLRHPIWLFDPETCRGLYANPPAMALWDAETLDELLARDFSKLSPAVRTRTERLARATADGQAVTERWTFYPKGQPVTVQAVISAYLQDDGRSVLLFEATPIDVEDEERRAVEALRHTSSLITLFTSDGSPVFANPAAISTYGDSVSFCERFSDRAYGKAVLQAVLEGNILAELVEVLSLVGTKSHHIDARQVLDPVTGEVSILLSERDVTAQVEAERALLVAEERAAASLAKEHFLSKVSHELRTPLNSILGYSAFLKNTNDLPPDVISRSETIYRAGESLLEAVNNIILLGECDKGTLQVIGGRFCLNDLIAKAVASFQTEATRKGLQLQIAEITPASTSPVGDSGKILTILKAFISNAIKFTAAGMVVVGAEIGPQIFERRTLTLYVRDSGAGMSQTACDLIRDHFRQSDQQFRRPEGVGLGLSVARCLSTIIDAEIELTSEIGEGTTFFLHLDLEFQASAAGAPLAIRHEEDCSRPLTILYADDHDNNRTLMSAIMESLGHECDLVSDGHEAVLAVRRKCYDLILMDIQMPIMDGVTAAQNIRNMHRCTTPIVAVTANTQMTELQRYESAGINDCIEKPLRIVDVATIIDRWGPVGSEG